MFIRDTLVDPETLHLDQICIDAEGLSGVQVAFKIRGSGARYLEKRARKVGDIGLEIPESAGKRLRLHLTRVGSEILGNGAGGPLVVVHKGCDGCLGIPV